MSLQSNSIGKGADAYAEHYNSLDIEILFGTEANLDEIFDSLDCNKDFEVIWFTSFVFFRG